MKFDDLYSPKRIEREPTGDYPLWFRHTSPSQLTIIKPQTYRDLKAIRRGYPVESRQQQETKYHNLLNNPQEQRNRSFIYATIMGYHSMDSALDYPGYSYYFILDKQQIDNCLFGIVANDPWFVEPQRGNKGLEHSIDIWRKNHHKYHDTYEKNIGIIQPRIEVVINFDVAPILYIDQIEDR